jgi:hypothetical protein
MKSADRLPEIPRGTSQWHSKRRILVATTFSEQLTSAQLPLVYSRIIFQQLTVNIANTSPFRHVCNY